MTSNLRGRRCCAPDCSSGLKHPHPSHSLLSCALGDDSIRLFDFPLQLFVPRQCPGSWCATCHLHLLLGTYFTSLLLSLAQAHSLCRILGFSPILLEGHWWQLQHCKSPLDLLVCVFTIDAQFFGRSPPPLHPHTHNFKYIHTHSVIIIFIN